MVKKGKLEQLISKGRFSDDPFSYLVFYRDFESIKQLTLPDFIEHSNNFQTIPASRIELIKLNNRILFKKSKLKAK